MYGKTIKKNSCLFEPNVVNNYFENSIPNTVKNNFILFYYCNNMHHNIDQFIIRVISNKDVLIALTKIKSNDSTEDGLNLSESSCRL